MRAAAADGVHRLERRRGLGGARRRRHLPAEPDHRVPQPGPADPLGPAYQARQALYALADGGLFGAGLGQGRAKWDYLPNADNDFIFAIIGEELGFVGGVRR